MGPLDPEGAVVKDGERDPTKFPRVRLLIGMEQIPADGVHFFPLLPLQGDRRSFRLWMDPNQYQLDMAAMQQGGEDVYGSFTVLMRRKPKVPKRVQKPFSRP